MSWNELRRDSFARATLVWTTVKNNKDRHLLCLFCGMAHRLRLYWWKPDSVLAANTPAFPFADKGGFCSLGCWEAYSGQSRKRA